MTPVALPGQQHHRRQHLIPPSGLTGIRDRVEAVGGTLAVHSPPGSGTVLTALLLPGDPFG
jgi:signal transduction histidine kinase